ncbi:MAG: glycosyltransferase [Planctomycetota bacterium]|nr:glycosyltransferase [Planctomycetota bacterium]
MLGWEFPPFISGGLGTACFGLTKALVAEGAQVSFALPRAIDRSHSSHVELICPEPKGDALPQLNQISRRAIADSLDTPLPPPSAREATTTSIALKISTAGTVDRAAEAFATSAEIPLPRTPEAVWMIVRRVLASMPQHDAYAAIARSGERVQHDAALSKTTPVLSDLLGLLSFEQLQQLSETFQPSAAPQQQHQDSLQYDAWLDAPIVSGGSDYSGDLMAASARFARFALASCSNRHFDVIHAHDWLTYPAGIALASLTGKPLVVHVHATEFDRSGDHVNQSVYNIERRGMHAATRVIAVSQLTRNLLSNRYGVSPAKIDVVYNGVDLDPTEAGIKRIDSTEKIVLYFGRITMQKGPEFFVRAAKRALEVMPNIRFVVAGSGDQAQRMIEMAAALGIGGRMTFTGFLRGRDIARIFQRADLYVMPSVSEPFGIAPLEAMASRVPAIISRSSGVSEVLSNALKVDFWDVDDIANKIVAVLRHPPLKRHLTEQGFYEVRGITWGGAAKRCLQSYARATAGLGLSPMGAPR